jgi:hypothetical protein
MHEGQNEHVCWRAGCSRLGFESEAYREGSLSRHRATVDRFARCFSRGLKWAVPFAALISTIQPARKIHRHYAILQASNERIPCVLDNGAERLLTLIGCEGTVLETIT